jgi:predicted HTH domain antitoxin
MVSIVYGDRCLPLKPLAVRVPAELDKEISEIIKKEKLDKATVVRNLLETGITEWRKQTAIELLGKGKVTFAQAADIAKLSLWEFADLVKQHNVEWVRFDPEEVENEFTSASTAEQN